MTERRFFVDVIEDGFLPFDDLAKNHAQVLRLKSGHPILCFDGKGKIAHGLFAKSQDVVGCDVNQIEQSKKRKSELNLLLAIGKGDKLEKAIRMAVEIGVKKIFLMDCDHGIARISKDKLSKKTNRFHQIIREAARQSESEFLPELSLPKRVDDVLELVKNEKEKIVFWARSTNDFKSIAYRPKVIALGPEGGFSERELKVFHQHGFYDASLGDSILRYETAIPVAMAMVKML